jgi:hypothetical protein
MTGGLGPMQSIAATGSMRIQLTAAEGATKFDVVYSVVGYLPAGMQTWAKPADEMLTEQFHEAAELHRARRPHSK